MQWILDRLWELGKIVSQQQAEIDALRDRLNDRDAQDEQRAREQAEKDADHVRERPAWWQVAIGAAGVLLGICSLIVAIVALRATH